MPELVTIGLIQREIIPHDPAGNLLATLETLETCTDQEVDLFVLTELWSTGLLDPAGPSDDPALNLAETIDGPTVEALQDYCSRKNVNLLAGTIAIRENSNLTNTAILIDRKGEIVLRYSKIHLFKLMGEDHIYVPGDKLYAVELDDVGVGVIICYDLRFPGLTRRLAHAGCELILVPALWPEGRINHWELMLRARASENQVYIVGANGLANQNGMFFPGHSMIVGPQGESLNAPEMRESVVVRKLDLKKLREDRARLCYLDEEIKVGEVHWNVRVNE